MTDRISPIFTIILLLWFAGRISSIGWTPRTVVKYFAAKNVYNVDAIICSERDGRDIFKYFTTIASSADEYNGLFRIISDIDDERYDPGVRTGIFIDFSCSSKQQILLNNTSDKWFTLNFIWLIWDWDEFLIELRHLLPISTFSDVTVATSKGLFQLSTSASSLPNELRSVGVWKNSSEEFILHRNDVRINFQKTSVIAAIQFIDEVFNKSELSQQLQDNTYKPDGDVSNRFIYGNHLHLAYLYNFTLDLVISENWGDRMGNGTWTGMLGLLQQYKADVILSPMIPLSHRLDVSYPGVPVLSYWMAAVFKQPRALGTYRAMILELSISTWACVGATVVLGAIVFALTQKYDPDPDASDQSDGSFALGALQSLGIMANQGLSVTPQGTSSRIVCLILLVVGLLVSNYYSAATMTALLSESPPVIKNLEQLMASKPHFSALAAPYIFNKIANRRVFHKIVLHKMYEENALTICSLEDCVQSVMNGSIFLGEYFAVFPAINKYLQSDTICDLTVFSAGFDANSVSFMKKCPHFRELHTRGIIRTLEHGLMKKERGKWIADRISCSRVVEFIFVQMEAVSVAFGIFLLGVFVSLTILSVEMFAARRTRLRIGGEIESFARTLSNSNRTPRFSN